MIARHTELVLSMSESELRRKANIPDSDLIKALELSGEGAYRQFWIPFDDVNESAEIVIVGLTPGFQQAEASLASMRRSALMKLSPEEIATRAKAEAAFKGNMRSLGARLMDHFDLHRLFGLRSTAELFGEAAQRVHCTSVLRYPVVKDGKNYSGDARMMSRPYLHGIALSTLPAEIERIGNPWIVTFGSSAAAAVVEMVAMGKISEAKLLTGILHPSGTQWNRYNVQLGITPPKEAASVPGGPEVIERSARLREKVAAAMTAA
jgi:hypothetical protein